ncbi:MAG: SDR family oxidoreductase [Pseudomonadota bacterium]
MAQTVLVTGGTRGIGKGIVAALARDYDVIALWRRTEPKGFAPQVKTLQADLSAPAGCQDAIARALTLSEDGALYGLVNNAGALAESAIDGFDPDPVQEMFHVNVIVPALLVAAALDHMPRGGRVVNISSVNADLPPKGAALYGASKAALNTWTRGAAKELGPNGILVNAVAPGAINTPEAPRPEELTQTFASLKALGRVGTPADIAGVVKFLLSDAAGFITGEVIRASGGYRL